MKRCRTCNRTYTDPNLSYCIDDGTPLITEAVADDESTVVNTSSRSERTTEDDWNAVAMLDRDFGRTMGQTVSRTRIRHFNTRQPTSPGY